MPFWQAARVSEIVLLRHGETEWSLAGRHTGRTDLPLTKRGRKRAKRLAPTIAERDFGLVMCSPLQRARKTAKLAGLKPDNYDDDLLEWDYGGFEGLTTAQIRDQLGDQKWLIWDSVVLPGATPGESPEEVSFRAARVIERCLTAMAAGQDCALVAHGHVLRILTATWLGLPARDGRLFALSTGTLSSLGFEHEQRVITSWNR